MEENLDTGAIKYDEPQHQPGGIPAFLKVLCILTFVGAGLGILSALYGLFTLQSSIATLETFADAGMVYYGDYIELLKKWGIYLQLFSLIGSGLCLAGALMMWKLKKTGYYLYIVGQILPFIGVYGLMGGAMPAMGPFQGLAMLGQIFAIIFPLAFIIMYTVNLKHLK